MKKYILFLTFTLLLVISLWGQEKATFTHEDTLRGSITPERAWWNVLRYDITVKPDFNTKSIEGKVKILIDKQIQFNKTMQIDLQDPLIIDSVAVSNSSGSNISFQKIDSNVWHIFFKNFPQSAAELYGIVTIYYHGTPREAINPPWDGGWIWKKDNKGRPWMSVACQGLGASVWYPCKDHQSDEPDNGASLSIIVPDSLVAVGNGRLASTQKNGDGTTTWKWEVKNPINNYDIVPYIGKYVNWTDTLHGQKGTLDMSYWVLDYDLDTARQQFRQAKPMLHSLEYWFGPYPFYEDGYKLVEAPHLGMEHQSAVGYGNRFHNGYHVSKGWIDLSGTGWGLKWDFIIEHESAHEWYGNSITSKDLADMWIHESFANYSETLYTEYLFGKDAGNEYNYGTRERITNVVPIIAHYNVNEESNSLDMYYKGGNLLQTIRHVINDDEKWRGILRGLNKTFYHQTVTTQQIENYISKNAGIDLGKVFDQYLRTTQIPQLEYYYAADKKKVCYRWDSCIAGFNMPLVLIHESKNMRIYPTQGWKTLDDPSFFDPAWIVKNYYIRLKEVAPNN